jgi:predicted nucleic acid-binding protein
MIQLDTNYIILALTPGTVQDRQIRAWRSQQIAINTSSVAWAEFLCGPVSDEHARLASVLFPSPEPFLSSDAVLAAHLFNQSGRRRGTLLDCMIAALSIRLNAELATENHDDFRPFLAHGLRLALTQP